MIQREHASADAGQGFHDQHGQARLSEQSRRVQS
jgi:hypothetical protein